MMNLKKVTFSLVLGLLVLAGAMAQNKNELKGPKHKNYKPWKNAPTEKVITSYDKTPEKGPEAKNYKPWKADKDQEDIKIVSTKATDKRLTGPKAKNAKPWNN